MNPRRLPFRLDNRDRKLLGVCAGIGRAIHVDPTLVRIAVVAVPLMTFVTFWQMLLAYLVCAMLGAAAASHRNRGSEFERMGERRRESIHDLRTKLDRRDRQMMAIDHHLNSQESLNLAREIEALRKEQA
jgi:phage shock protein PspC (stress-responsive transcriptional regulator)